MNPVMQRDDIWPLTSRCWRLWREIWTCLLSWKKDMSQSVSSVQSVNDLENTKYLEKDLSQSVSSVQSVNDLENSKSDTQWCRDEIPAEKKGKSMRWTKLFLIIIILNNCLCLCLAYSCHICGKTFSRKDRLISHLNLTHDEYIDLQKPSYSNRFFCPFKCESLPPFRTMKLLLHHCQSIHKESLGMCYNTPS